MGCEIRDAERVYHGIGCRLDDDAGPFIGNGRRNLEAPVRHAAPSSPSGPDGIRETDRFAAAKRFPRFGPSEKNFRRRSADPGFLLGEASPDAGDQVCAGEDWDRAGFDSESVVVSPEDTRDPCADCLSQDGRLGVVGHNRIEVSDTVDAHEPPIAIPHVSANDAERVEIRLSEKKATCPNADFRRVIESDLHRPTGFTGCQDPAGVGGRLGRLVTTSATATAAAAAKTATLSTGFMVPERSDLVVLSALQGNGDWRAPRCYAYQSRV